MLRFVSCPATFLLETNLPTKKSDSNFQPKHRIERDGRNWVQESEISLKHSVMPACVSQRHVLVSPSLVLPGRMWICLVVDFSLVVAAGTLKAIWTLKVSQNGYKQPEIMAVGLLLA